jgi:hypothetical protein
MECKLFGPRTTGPADRIALRGVRILSRLSGMSQRTTVEQTYVNLEPGPIEAVYTFPLPPAALAAPAVIALALGASRRMRRRL